MTFTPGIPASGQSLGSSRTQVLNNFAVLRSTIATNHVDVNSTGAGKHNFSEYVVQAQSPATLTGEVALYTRTVSGVAQLFLQKENQLVAAADIQMSRLDKGALNSGVGYSFLPGGLLIQWASQAGVANNTAIVFPIPFTTACYSLVVGGGVVTGTQPIINFNQSSLSATGFVAKIDGPTPINYYYIAIGS